MNQSLFINRQKSSSCFTNRAYQFTKQRKHYSIKKNCQKDIQYPFKPQIHELPLQLYCKTSKTECSKQEIFQRLINNKKKLKQDLKIQKQIEDNKKHEQNCTFIPQINQKSKKLWNHFPDQSIFQRLYKQKNKEKCSTDFSEIVGKENYQFQPQLKYNKILNSENRDLRPIYQRIQQIINQKRQNLKMLREKQQKQKQKIHINPKSEQIIKNKKQYQINFLARVSNYINQKKQKQKNIQQQLQYKRYIQCPFKPIIGPTTLHSSSISFLNRQKIFTQELQQKIDQKISKIYQQQFKPQINKISNLLVKSMRQNQTFQDKMDRYLIHPIIEKQQKLQKIELQTYKQCTFQPEINTISKVFHAKHKGHTCDCLPQQQHYDFQPKINPNSRQLAQKNRRNQSKLEKNQIIEKTKMQLQYKQLKQCTFHPKLIAYRKKSKTNLSNINGMDIITKKIQMIKKKKVQDQKIKEKIFNLQKRYKYRKKTQIEEFKLSQGHNHQMELKEQQKERFAKQCTFQPNINHLR